MCQLSEIEEHRFLDWMVRSVMLSQYEAYASMYQCKAMSRDIVSNKRSCKQSTVKAVNCEEFNKETLTLQLARLTTHKSKCQATWPGSPAWPGFTTHSQMISNRPWAPTNWKRSPGNKSHTRSLVVPYLSPTLQNMNTHIDVNPRNLNNWTRIAAVQVCDFCLRSFLIAR